MLRSTSIFILITTSATDTSYIVEKNKCYVKQVVKYVLLSQALIVANGAHKNNSIK